MRVCRRNRLSKPDMEAARKSLSSSNKTSFSSSACYAFDTMNIEKRPMFVKNTERTIVRNDERIALNFDFVADDGT